MPAEQSTDHNREAVATYVWFERTQLALVFKGFQNLEKLSPPPDPGQHQFLKNILLASFLLHTRVLRDFLFYPRKWDDDVVAEDFLAEWDESVEKWCPYLHENKSRLDKSLAHLSYERIDFEPNKEWDCGRIHTDLKAAWDEFWDRLTPEKQEWFTRPRE